MRLWTWQKPKISIEQFCGKIYDNCIFFPICGHAEDMRFIFWREIFDSIVKIDNNFQHIGLDIFTREMTALQAELFGLAWMHHFTLEQYHSFEEKYTFGEIVFTKNYMEQHGHSEIWNIMSYYNKTIADALLHPRVMAIERARSPLNAVKDEISFYLISRKYDIRNGDVNDKWSSKIGLDCATRVLNRMSFREDWGGRPMALMLTMTFAERLGWKVDLKDECFAGYEELLNRLYNDFKQAIEMVDIK